MGDGFFDVRILKGDPKRIAREMRAEGQREFRKNLRKVITDASKPVRRKIRDAALEQLPKRGGLNKWAAVLPAAVTDFRGDTQSIKIVDRKRGHDMKALDAGRIRHPLYGKRSHWYEQNIPAGFFTRTVEKNADDVRRAVDQGISNHLKKLEGKL